MKNLEISENDYQKVIEIVKKYEELYYETYTVKRNDDRSDCITIIGKEMSYPMLKKIERETNIIGWGIHPTLEEIDGIKEGVKIYLYKQEKAAY